MQNSLFFQFWSHHDIIMMRENNFTSHPISIYVVLHWYRPWEHLDFSTLLRTEMRRDLGLSSSPTLDE
jgi:hypothetical protein